MIFVEVTEIAIHTHTHTDSPFFVNPAVFSHDTKTVLLRWPRIYPEIMAKREDL